MTHEEIARAASKGRMPDEPMTCPERCYFYAMRDIYRQFHDGSITRQDGEKSKQKALRQLQEDEAVFYQGKEIQRLHGEMWGKIEASGSLYRKEPTIEHADAFLEAVYGCGRKKAEVL